ncbi:hypothetical protein PSTG_13702 [Puccinia striiformis f. sp. tritici PST-78]|uniref:Uncharacterized protein n=1 Tax=Puccinia striiformis f. sp. tritici PST-78 TaxID=1165861 RepID=A0A0L0V0W0_9BASI|nr:hypothetical protein PSTG_13702 [Puccinia striiformis f. sp. tritici PST-78]
MGPTESFIAFSGRARVLQSLINFDDSLPPSSDSKLPSTIVTHLTDFDLAEFVVLGVKNEAIHGDIAKFALLDAIPFSYPAFEKRVACFDEVTTRKTSQRAPRAPHTEHAPSNSPPDPVAWRVHAYLDSQGQCHHCKTTCGSAPGMCIKPLNKKWLDIPDSFHTPRRPADYKPPQAHGPSSSSAGRPTQPPAGRPPPRSASLAAITDSSDSNQPPSSTDYVEVIESLDSDKQTFAAAAVKEQLPPDLTPGDWATLREIDEILSDNVANVEEDETSVCDSEYCSDLGRDAFDNASSSP